MVTTPMLGGLSVSLAPGQSITSASLTFTDVKLTAANSSGKGVLYSDLHQFLADGRAYLHGQ